MKILLNGLGRIGKAILRESLLRDDIDIVAINEINPNIQNIAYNINYDSSYGRLENRFEIRGTSITNADHHIKIFHEQSLENIDLDALKVSHIIDATGNKINHEMIKKLAVRGYFVTHPDKNADINVILGVNETTLTQNHTIISTSSCNATALLPALKTVDEYFGIECGEITTIHPVLNHQKLLDSNCIGSQSRQIDCNFEFGRSAMNNIIPSKTTTIEACSYVLPYINQTLISSASLRIPTQTVGIIDATLLSKKRLNKQELIELFEQEEEKQSFRIYKNSDEALVSGDFKADPYTTIIDHRFSDVVHNKLIKLAIWYDNEWGYATKVLDIVKHHNKTFK